MGNTCCSGGKPENEVTTENITVKPEESIEKVEAHKLLTEEELIQERQNEQKQKSSNKDLKKVHLPQDQEGKQIDSNFEDATQKNSQVKEIEEQLGDYFLSQQFKENEKIIKNGQYYTECYQTSPHSEQGVTYYKGFWQNGKKQGRGEIVWQDGSVYQGLFENNLPHICGRMIHADGTYYIGQWQFEKMEGQGSYVHTSGKTYQGEWIQDKQHGKGKEVFPAQNYEYEGQFRNGEKNGNGVSKWKDGSSYIGSFENNMIHGKGIYEWADHDKRKYDGEWYQGKMQGEGLFTWDDGRKYNGQYLDNQKHGYGEFDWPDGRWYKGNWVDGKMHGNGKFGARSNQQINGENKQEYLEGIWENGKLKKVLEEKQLQDLNTINTVNLTLQQNSNK